jgi:ribose transport system substrate-binding protein
MSSTGRKSSATLAVCILMAGLVACGSDSAKTSSGGSPKAANLDGKTIGLSMHFMADDYSRDFAKTIKKEAEAAGAKVITDSADGDPGKQLSDIQSLVARHVDAIIVIPIDEAGIVPAIKTAKQADIPVLSASPIPAVDKDLTAVIGPSDFGNGKAACAEMAKAIDSPGAAVAISTASVKLYRIEQRVLGCKEALKESGLKIVATTAGLSPEEGLKNAQNLLSAHDDLKGIFASFSNLVLGAGNAVKQSGRDDVQVSGIDADRTIIKQIAAGNVTDVAAQFPTEQAKLIVTAATTLLSGGTVPHDQQDKLPTRTVDADNYQDRYQEIWGEPYPAG